MNVTFKEILRLPTMEKVKLVGGKNGLYRPIRWIYVAEVFEDIRTIADWVNGGEIIFITGLGVKKNTEVFIDLIKKINSKEVAGLFAFIGPYMTNVPEEVIELADSLDFPIFEIPWEVKLVEVSKDICSYITKKDIEKNYINTLLEDLFFGEMKNIDSLIEKTSFYGYNMSLPIQAVIFDIDNFDNFLNKNEINQESEIMKIKIKFRQIISDGLEEVYGFLLNFPIKDSITFFLPTEYLSKTELIKLLDKIKKEFNKKMNGMTVSIGIGKEYNEIKGLTKSINESQRIIKLIKQFNELNTTIFYNDLGIYSLLLNVNDNSIIEELYDKYLGTLERYSLKDKGTLMNTLKVFLDESGRHVNASEKLFIHRNTLKYRLDKIEKLCGCNLEDSQECFNLRLAFSLKKFLGKDKN